MDFKILNTLDSETIKNGIKTYFENAKDLFESGKILAEKGRFGQATALTVLSIEELSKAYATFMFFMGDNTPGNIDAAFRGTIDSNSVHQARLKYASGISFLSSILKTDTLIEKVSKIANKKFDDEAPNFNSDEERNLWISNLINEIIPQIADTDLGITDTTIQELEDTLKDSTNWFLHAKTHKENGLYADLLNNKWHSPSKMTKKSYDEAHKHGTEIFHLFGDIITNTIYEDGNALNFVQTFTKRFIEARPHNSSFK